MKESKDTDPGQEKKTQAALDEYIAVAIHGSEVAGVIPALLIDGLLGSLLVLAA